MGQGLNEAVDVDGATTLMLARLPLAHDEVMARSASWRRRLPAEARSPSNSDG